MPAGTERRVVLKDAQGKGHNYQTYLLNGWEGLPLFAKVQDAAVDLLAHGAEGFGVGGGKGTILEREVKATEVVMAIKPAIKLLCTDTEFMLALFKHTMRDGVQLGDPGQMGIAFQGNYGEFYAASIWLVRENFIDPLVASLGELLGADLVQKAIGLFERFSSGQESTG